MWAAHWSPHGGRTIESPTLLSTGDSTRPGAYLIHHLPSQLSPHHSPFTLHSQRPLPTSFLAPLPSHSSPQLPLSNLSSIVRTCTSAMSPHSLCLSLLLISFAVLCPHLSSAQPVSGPLLSVPLNSSTIPRWINYGGDGINSHSQTLPFSTVADTVTRWTNYTALVGAVRPSNLVITPLTVPSLALKWRFNMTAPIVSSPAVGRDGSLYIGEYGGGQSIYKLNGTTGAVLWQINVTSFLGLNSTDGVRTTPALSAAEDVIVLGSQTVGLAYIFALSTANGALLWLTQVDPHPAAFITGSPAIDPSGQIVVASVSSDEESLVTNQPGYVCCTFRGSVAGLSLSTGAIVWQFYMIPANQTGVGLYSGGAMWGSSVPFDDQGLLVASGNLYDAPISVQQCVNTTLGTPAEDACVPSNIYFESVLKLNVSNGALLWAWRSNAYDAWTTLCGSNLVGGTKKLPTSGCPVLPYEDDLDRDFGQYPVMFGDRHYAIGQKSGIFYMGNRYTGAQLWNSTVGPPGQAGGSEFGSAVEPVVFNYSLPATVQTSATPTAWRLYAGSANSNGFNDTLLNGVSFNYGSFIAYDALSGTTLWKTALPDKSESYGTISASNGVVFAGSTGANFYALDGSTGNVLWSFPTHSALGNAGPIVSGPAITADSIYWGSGRNSSTPGILYAFSVNPTSAVTTVTAPTSGVLGDPQFIGLAGQSFQVHGIDGQVYSLIIDDVFHLNARFVFLSQGQCPPKSSNGQNPCWSHPGSYLGELGLRTVDGHALVVVSGPASAGFASVTLDERVLVVGEAVSVGRLTVSLDSAYRLSFRVSAFEVVVQNSDLFVNLVSVRVVNPSGLHSHGLLGQTWTAPESTAYDVAPVAGYVDDYAEANNDLLGSELLYRRRVVSEV